jgi:hypothetical protein
MPDREPHDAHVPSVDAAGAIPPGESAVGPPVPCVHCDFPIPAESFVYWSLADDLVAAECAGCAERMTLGAAAWRRWTRDHPASTR